MNQWIRQADAAPFLPLDFLVGGGHEHSFCHVESLSKLKMKDDGEEEEEEEVDPPTMDRGNGLGRRSRFASQ